MTNIPCPMRWYGDYEIGEKFILGSVEIDEKEPARAWNLLSGIPAVLGDR